MEYQKISELLEKKQNIYDDVNSGTFNKIEISISLNELNDVDMINAWNELQKCVQCDGYITLKQNFLRVVEDSISKDKKRLQELVF